MGEIVLANGDGALDALADYGFDGRALRVPAGDAVAVLAPLSVLDAVDTDTFGATSTNQTYNSGGKYYHPKPV